LIFFEIVLARFELLGFLYEWKQANAQILGTWLHSSTKKTYTPAISKILMIYTWCILNAWRLLGAT
jgi:hypothetical protein